MARGQGGWRAGGGWPRGRKWGQKETLLRVMAPQCADDVLLSATLETCMTL